MRTRLVPGAFGLTLLFAAGCFRIPAPAAPERPQFENELVHTTPAAGGGRTKQTHHDDGKPHSAVLQHTDTFKQDGVEIKVGVQFIGRRDGKDMYQIEYTVTAGGKSETVTREVAYEGVRLVVVPGPPATYALQPPGD